MRWRLSRVDSHLGRRELEDQPSLVLTIVDVVGPQHIDQQRSDGFGVG